MTRAPVTLFSVKGTRLTNPEGDANFTSLRDGVDASLEKVAQANIPTTDQGPIYVPGQGPMEWVGAAYAPLFGTMALRNITVSTSDPSGGVDGDIWFKV